MKIAVLPGDGIGPEIIAQAVEVLKALSSDGLKIEMEQAPIGGAGYDAAGDPLPAATLKLAQEADAVLLGAVGGWNYDTLPRPMRPEQGLLRIRKGLELFANLRPALLYPELADASTLKPEVVSAHKCRASILQVMGRAEEAKVSLDKAAEIEANASSARDPAA